MSRILSIRCPHCNQEFDYEATDLLTPDNTAALQALLKGTLNIAECPACRQSLNVPVRMIYRDSTRPALLVHELHQPADENELQAMTTRLDAEATEAARHHGTIRPALRLVFTRPDFIEKLVLHERGFDDRLMEYAKFQLFNGGADGQISPLKHRLLYDFSQSDQNRIVFIVFNRQTGRPVRLLQIPFEEYSNLSREFQESRELQHELEHLFPGCLVDVSRIFAKFSKEKEQNTK